MLELYCRPCLTYQMVTGGGYQSYFESHVDKLVVTRLNRNGFHSIQQIVHLKSRRCQLQIPVSNVTRVHTIHLSDLTDL